MLQVVGFSLLLRKRRLRERRQPRSPHVRVPCGPCRVRPEVGGSAEHRPIDRPEIVDQNVYRQEEALQHIPQEPWEQIHVLSETDAEVRFLWQTSSG